MNEFEKIYLSILEEGVSIPEFAYGEKLWSYVYSNANPYIKLKCDDLKKYISKQWKFYDKLNDIQNFELTVLFYERVDENDVNQFLNFVKTVNEHAYKYMIKSANKHLTVKTYKGIDLTFDKRTLCFSVMKLLHSHLNTNDSSFSTVDSEFQCPLHFMSNYAYDKNCLICLKRNKFSDGSLKRAFFHELSHFFQYSLHINMTEVDKLKNARLEALENTGRIPSYSTPYMHHDFRLNNLESIIRRKHDILINLKKVFFNSKMSKNEFIETLERDVKNAYENTLKCKSANDFMFYFKQNSQLKINEIYVLDLITLYGIQRAWTELKDDSKLKDLDLYSYEDWMKKEKTFNDSPEFSFDELIEDFKNELK